MNKVVFLDRDGTINIDFGYVYQPERLEFLPGVLEALRKIQECGYQLIIVTNQSGIGRGMFSEKQYEVFNSYMLEQMKGRGVHISKIYTCPHVDEEQCDCRKPKIGLFEDAIREYDVDLKNSYAIGDRMRDLKVCEKYPICGIYLNADIACKNTDDSDSKESVDGVVELSSWEAIADYICK